MTDFIPNPGEERPTPILASLLRCAADGELNADEQRALEEHLRNHPGDAQRIEFDRSLRDACRRVMQSESAPAGLRDRILATASGARAEERDALDAGLSARRGETSRRSFWARSQGRLQLAAAAVLLIVAGVFLFQIARIGTGPSTGAYAEVAAFVGTEHVACEVDAARAEKMSIHDFSEVPRALSDIVGKSPTLPDLVKAGLTFIDGGECAVPGGGRSMHLRFDAVCPISHKPTTVSLFVQDATDSTLELSEGASYRLRARGDPNGSVIYAWRRDGLDYFLVSDLKTVCESVREAAEVPKPIAAP
ncbi:MAG: hypothetical protein H6811_08320 [Phycisphaeraceae bacterium]|nr:hypothetical protein [Phycisphaeraceae bacterium]